MRNKANLLTCACIWFRHESGQQQTKAKGANENVNVNVNKNESRAKRVQALREREKVNTSATESTKPTAAIKLDDVCSSVLARTRSSALCLRERVSIVVQVRAHQVNVGGWPRH